MYANYFLAKINQAIHKIESERERILSSNENIEIKLTEGAIQRFAPELSFKAAVEKMKIFLSGCGFTVVSFEDKNSDYTLTIRKNERTKQ